MVVLFQQETLALKNQLAASKVSHNELVEKHSTLTETVIRLKKEAEEARDAHKKQQDELNAKYLKLLTAKDRLAFELVSQQELQCEQFGSRTSRASAPLAEERSGNITLKSNMTVTTGNEDEVSVWKLVHQAKLLYC